MDLLLSFVGRRRALLLLSKTGDRLGFTLLQPEILTDPVAARPYGLEVEIGKRVGAAGPDQGE